MCTYLAKRNSTYYFRRVIPVELRPHFEGRAEFMMSLRTKDREQAKRLIPAKTAATDRLLEQARQGSAKEGPETAHQASFQTMTDAEYDRFEHALEGAEIAGRAMAEKEYRYEDREPLRQRLEAAFRKSTAEITPLEAAMRDLLNEAREGLTPEQAEQARPVVERAENRRGLSAPSERPVAVPASSGVMLDSKIVDLWAAERKPVKKGIDTHRSVARWFYDRVGEKPVEQITRRDVLLFKNKLVEEGQSAANIIMKLSRLRTLLQWATDNEYLATNPATGVRMIDTDRARNRRMEFDLGSLNAIFSSPVYSDDLRPTQGRGQAAYWLPLLALFTGARLEELGQLRPGDVQEIAYPDTTGAEQRSWFIRIREDEADSLRLKNAASERDVPVHPELIRLGFLSLVTKASEDKQDWLFPSLRANIYGRRTAKWGEWFGSYLREVCKVTDRRLVFHSFRHTFKQYARHAGIVEGVQRQIMGHSSSDVADEYGSGYPLHQVVAGMASFAIPGLRIGATSRWNLQ